MYLHDPWGFYPIYTRKKSPIGPARRTRARVEPFFSGAVKHNKIKITVAGETQPGPPLGKRGWGRMEAGAFLLRPKLLFVSRGELLLGRGEGKGLGLPIP